MECKFRPVDDLIYIFLIIILLMLCNSNKKLENIKNGVDSLKIKIEEMKNVE